MLDKLSKKKKLERAKKIFLDAAADDRAFQKEAKEDFAFRDGFQWSKEEKDLLESEMRPALTFNLTKSQCDLVMGMNEDNRIKYRCTPVEKNDAFLCEVLNNILDWVYDYNDFEDEEDALLESSTICGRGYAAVDFVPNPDRFGEIDLTMVEIPVHEAHPDPNSRRPLFEDAAYITWDRWMPKEDFLVKYPHISRTKLESMLHTGKGWGLEEGYSMSPNDIFTEASHTESSEFDDYEEELDVNFYNRAKGMVRVVHMEYWMSYKRYYAFDPETGTWNEFDGSKLKDIKAAFEAEYKQDFVYETIMDKKVKWFQFTGNDILYDGDSPLPFKGFSIVGMFAFRDASKRTANHYGLVRLIKDPQKEVNKRWSQSLHMLNQQVQTGVFAETEAFVDDQQARLSLKEPGSITWLNAGGLNRIQERTIPKFPNAPMQLEEASQHIMKKITGINPDLLGQDRGRQEPGVVVRLRQQQGITLLKPLFRSFNRAKKEVFKRFLSIIMEYMPDEQILRILGSNERYQIDKQSGIIIDQATGLQAAIRDVRNIEYNIRSEEAPGNMTKRMMELATFMEMKNVGFPIDPQIIIEKTDLPQSEKLRWAEYIQTQEQQAMESVQQERQEDMELEERKISVDETRNLMEFITDMAKIEAGKEKDDKSMMSDLLSLSVEKQRDIANTITEMAKMMTQVEVAKQKGASDGGSAGKQQGKTTKSVST